jgi:hypothetical protein
MGVDVMRPVFNLESKYRVTMLTRQECTRGPGTPPVVKVFQAKVYAILAGVHEIETQHRPERYVRVCSDSQAALKTLQAAKTTSPLARQCQKALSDISTWHTVGLYCVPGHAGLRENEITDQLAKRWFCSKVCWT